MSRNAKHPDAQKDVTTAAFAAVGSLGLHLVTGTLVGGVIGYALDAWLDTSPWLLLFFLLIGAGAGYKNILEDVHRLNHADGAKTAQSPGMTKKNEASHPGAQ